MTDACEWLTGSGSTFETDCGHESLIPLSAIYCPHCGKKILITHGEYINKRCEYTKGFIVCGNFRSGVCESPDGKFRAV